MLERGSLGYGFRHSVSCLLSFAGLVFNGFDTEIKDDEVSVFTNN